MKNKIQLAAENWTMRQRWPDTAGLVVVKKTLSREPLDRWDGRGQPEREANPVLAEDEVGGGDEGKVAGPPYRNSAAHSGYSLR